MDVHEFMWRLNAGSIVSLEDLWMMPNLLQVALYRQQIMDLSPLEGLPLMFLALSNNPVHDFSVLRSLPQLREANLNATHFADASLLTE